MKLLIKINLSLNDICMFYMVTTYKEKNNTTQYLRNKSNYSSKYKTHK